jgi:hypothetical protein
LAGWIELFIYDARMLVDALRRRLGSADVHSFQLMGEDLALLTGGDLREAAEGWARELERVPAAVRARFIEAQARVQAESHRFLRKYNRSVHTRIAGYLELGRRLRFEYPWPVVAILGIEQVLTGIRQNRFYGLVGAAVERLWKPLTQLAEGAEDVLRRTNRGIFADSAPTVMLALAAVDARAAGDGALAEALLDGPLPPLMDGECRALARALADGLGIADGAARFAALSRLTLRHFAREQAIFTHQMGETRGGKRSALLERLVSVRAVPAPVIEHRGSSTRVVMRPFALPEGFDMRDHATRVDAFGRAFVSSVTGSMADYRAAVLHVLRRFGRKGERAQPYGT